jgi:gas vesicle protein
MYEQEDKSWSFAIGLFVGALAGAALATLFTPRSGQQNRELVLEKGLVLKDRVTDVTSSVATSVKDTTNTAVTSVKGTTSSAVSSVKETTSSAVSSVKDVTTTAVSRVSDTVSTVKEAAGTAVEKVSDTASSTVEKIQSAASTAVEKVGDVTTTATEKARELTGRAQGESQAATADLPSTTTLASEARYDAEDVRPATTTAPTSTITSQPNVGLTSTTTEEETTYAAASRMTAGISPESRAAASELASPEQFETTDAPTIGGMPPATHTRTVAGTDADVREASEGADRNG